MINLIDILHSVSCGDTQKMAKETVLLATEMLGNPTSPKYRELVTAKTIGEPVDGMHGYDAVCGSTGRFVEIKTQIKADRKKLTGRGCANDYTFSKLQRELEDNVIYCYGGFVGHELALMLTYNYREIAHDFLRQLNECDEKGGRVVVRWSYTQWINLPSTRLVYKNDKLFNTHHISSPFLQKIKELKQV